MSFLNPVNEPVLRFSSTDAGAPQINYNAPTAGDRKTVIKACLVTGYGAKASAGWSIINEVDHVAEFVSPNAAMSDYRLGIDDTSAANTTWYYQYQDVRTNPSYNTPSKGFGYANKTHASNGWQMLVTERGFVFIEIVEHSTVEKLSTRITYWGAIKSALTGDIGKNMCFFNVGHSGTITQGYMFYTPNKYVHGQIGSTTNVAISSATAGALSPQVYIQDVSNVDLVSPIYLADDTRGYLAGELPSMLSKIVNASADLYGVSEFAIDGRNVLSVRAGYANNTLSVANSYSRTFLIRTDYWGY